MTTFAAADTGAIIIESERDKDGPAIERLLDAAFGPGRFAKAAYRLREGVDPVEGLSFVARAPDGGLLGSVRYTAVTVGASPALMLGPLAVTPERQRNGIGLALIRDSLAAATALDHGLVLLVGDEAYYAKAGFARVPLGRMTMPGPVDYARLLYRELRRGALEGVAGAIRARR